MKGCLRVVRGNEVKLTLPGPSISIKSDGTLWYQGSPILGIEEQTEKARIAEIVKSKKYDAIPPEYFTRLGDNPNGLWAGDDEMWAPHPLKTMVDHAAAIKTIERAKMVVIYLSSRGWGDYSPVEWHGDITRPDADILSECRNLLINGYDVDQPSQSDEDIIAKIKAARMAYELSKEPIYQALKDYPEIEDIDSKVAGGYCFNCESYCHGDCGHYSNDPQVKFRRDLARARCEENYGLED